MKSLLIVLSLLALSSCFLIRPEVPTVSSKANLQKVFNGFWEYAGLQDPVKAINCFNEISANLSMIFIGQFLQDVSTENGLQLAIDFRHFETNLPPATTQCLGEDPEVAELAQAYNVTNTAPRQLLTQIVTYVAQHLGALSQNASTGNFFYRQGMYKNVGTIFGQVFQQMVSQPSQIVATKKNVKGVENSTANLQDFYNGLFENVKLADPTTPVSCYNETTAHVTLDFYQAIVGDVASNDYLGLVREWQTYKSQLPQSVIDCIQNNAQLQQVYAAYGLDNENPKTLLQKYGLYYLKHRADLINATSTINEDMSDSDYYDAGKESGVLVQAILSN